MPGCLEFLGLVRPGGGVIILCSGSCEPGSGHSAPVKLQQGKYYSLVCSFLIST